MYSSNLTLRVAEANDLSALDDLFGQSYPALLKPDYAPAILDQALPLISKAQSTLVTSGSFFVVCEDKDVVGAGGWTRQAPGGKPETPGIGHIRHIVTDHHRTRRGIGRILMNHILSDAKAAGIEQLHCQSTRTAVSFYESMGFVQQSELEIPLAPGIVFPAIFMTQTL